MTSKLADKSCRDFAEVLSSKAPVPGGGGVAALVGALSSALCSMVGNITSGRKKYAQYEDDIQRVLGEAEKTRLALIDLIDKDAESFEPLQKAYSIPKDDPKRPDIMEKVSIDACQAPIETMRQIARTIELLEEMNVMGSITVKSDVGCGALCAKAALECASMNIYINTKGLEAEAARDLEDEADELLREYLPRAEAVAAIVMNDLRSK